MNIKKGDILKWKGGNEEVRVITVYDGLYAVDYPKDDEIAIKWYSEEQLKKHFDLPEEKWVPEEGNMMFFVSSDGTVDYISFDNKFSRLKQMQSIGNCFPTKELAEAKLKEVLAVFKK